MALTGEASANCVQLPRYIRSTFQNFSVNNNDFLHTPLPVSFTPGDVFTPGDLHSSLVAQGTGGGGKEHQKVVIFTYSHKACFN